MVKSRSSVGRASASGAEGQRFESSRGNHQPMNATELKKVCKKLYGYGWQTRLAEQLGVDGSTVRRWVSGAVPIPNPVAAAVRCFEGQTQ